MIEDDRILSVENVYNAVKKRYGLYRYKILDHIAFNGDQFIDTGVIAKSTLRIQMSAEFDQQKGSDRAVFGGRDNSQSTSTFTLWLKNSTTIRFSYGRSTIDFTVPNIVGKFDIDANKNEITINSIKKTASVFSFISANTIRIASNFTNTGSEYNDSECNDLRRFSGKLFYFKIYDDGILVRDYIPVMRIGDNAIGLYDKIFGVFYKNNGSGSFSPGQESTENIEEPDNPNILANLDYFASLFDKTVSGDFLNRPMSVKNLKNALAICLPYKKIEYIQSSGTQYINTEFIPDNNSRIIYDAYRFEASSADYFFGVRTSNQNSNGFNLYIYNSGWKSGYGTQVRSQNGAPVGRYFIDKNKNVTNINNGQIVFTATAQTFTCTGPAYLFALNSTGMNPVYGKQRLYKCQIYDNSVLVRDYIPVIRKIDNAIGLYDTVNDVFYSNSGTGSFIAGPEV